MTLLNHDPVSNLPGPDSGLCLVLQFHTQRCWNRYEQFSNSPQICTTCQPEKHSSNRRHFFYCRNIYIMTRTVQFAPIVFAVPANPLRSDAWYSIEELRQFKEEARQIINSSSVQTERGFECTNPQRRKHRHMTIRCTLSAARQGFSAHDLSEVSQKCSAWCLEAAVWQGCHDYASVYQPDVCNFFPELQAPIFPFAMNKKFSPSDHRDESDERPARRRRVSPLAA